MGSDMIEVAFPLAGRCVPQDHRAALAAAVQQALPWLAEAPGAGVRGLNLVREGDGELLVSPRTRLVLRVPRAQAEACRALAGAELRLGEHTVRALAPQVRELLAYGTLYAPLVAAGAADEAAFVAGLRQELDALEVPAQPICGRWQAIEAGRVVGCSVMLAGLAAAQSLRLLHRGLGPHRLLGCGLFVPHRSAAAVGAPA